MHYNIECFYNEIDVEDDGSLEWKYFKEFNDSLEKKLTPYRTEWMVWDRELRLAGSVDMLFENPDGTLQIYDWKRSKKVVKENRWASAIVDCISHLPDANFWKYSLQLNTYKWILEKNYGKKVLNLLENHEIRAHLDDRNETVGKKIRESEMKKIPFMIVVGDNEVKNDTISIRRHQGDDLGEMKIEKFIDIIKNEISDCIPKFNINLK